MKRNLPFDLRAGLAATAMFAAACPAHAQETAKVRFSFTDAAGAVRLPGTELPAGTPRGPQASDTAAPDGGKFTTFEFSDITELPPTSNNVVGESQIAVSFNDARH